MYRIVQDITEGRQCGVRRVEMKRSDEVMGPGLVHTGGSFLPNRLGLGNLHDSLYVEYWGWEYGLPEKSPPARQEVSHEE